MKKYTQADFNAFEVIDGNGDKSDNRRDNLVCFPKAEHTRRHQIERKK